MLVSNQLYGRTTLLFTSELTRLGIQHTLIDPCDLTAVRDAAREQTKMVIVETIANPLLRVVDIGALAEIAHQVGAVLLVDNTFATPAICKPLALGADLVIDVGKFANGHGDVMLGMLAGKKEHWSRGMVNALGICRSPLECWLASEVSRHCLYVCVRRVLRHWQMQSYLMIVMTSSRLSIQCCHITLTSNWRVNNSKVVLVIW